ncbi:hypothetical protein [Flavobacterium sp. 5]|uniref:hypothetical protein n=1 Tax=Flavobacterium sp. 5 TaxID=2035199 RepID=UPI000C2CAB28|nr:hypothetical protein [Flavobacterium sp. 5]PKB18048.1 hypothetical protein CLU82_3303 [Flavobacterium sp. 5]
MIGKEIKIHNLKKLYDTFEKLILTRFNQQIPLWFKNTILAINDFDPESITFRYGSNIETEEYLLDLYSLKIKINLIEKAFVNIHLSLH